MLFLPIIFVLCLTVIESQSAAPADPTLDIVSAEEHCITVFPSITFDMLEEIKRNRKFGDNTSRDMKCFVHCVGRKLEKFKEDGEYHFDGLKKLTLHFTEDVAYDEAHGMVSKCIMVEDPDVCEKAFKYASCKLAELTNFKLTKEFCKTC